MSLSKRLALLFAISLFPLFLGSAAAQGNEKGGKGDAAKGKVVFHDNGCFLCHDIETGESKRPPAPSLKGVFKSPPPHKLVDGTEHKEHTDAMLRKIITEGTKAMNPRGAVLFDDELDDLMAYLRSL